MDDPDDRWSLGGLEVRGGDQDAPPKRASLRLGIIVDADESDRRPERLHAT
jgi:hypothetical protein